MSTFDGRKARAAVAYARDQWRNDGAEGETVHVLANAVDRLLNASELVTLADRIQKGRRKYPNGCTVLSLLDEAGEVAHAVNKYESAERIREELLDVAAVAMRLYFGEIDRGLEIDGLVQRRTDEPVPPISTLPKDGNG